MLFTLPDILTAEAAGRAMALRVTQPVEIGVAPCLAGAAALVAARLLLLRKIPVTIALTDPSGDGNTPFHQHLRLLQKMKAPFNVEESVGEEEFPCVISGTDTTATMGSSSFLVARAFLESEHPLRWDGWLTLKNPYFSPAASSNAITVAEARELDHCAQEGFGLPLLCLMEQAGIGAAVVAAELAGKDRALGEIVVLAGPGNNGGDAFVVARGLLEKGLPVRIVPFSTNYAGEALANLRILHQQAQFIDSCRDENTLSLNRLEQIVSSARLIVDGLFGTGLSREVTREYAQVIELVNACRVPVLSLDVPSGLNADNGEIMGCCVKATRTVTFAAPKKGLFAGAGPEQSGEILVASIGNPV